MESLKRNGVRPGMIMRTGELEGGAMSLLPAVVPLEPAKRSEVVPTRLARNLAPLFGVPSPVSPFGSTTWLCDFTRITLSEIARGAPLPTREQARALRDSVPDGGWVYDGRAVLAAPGTTLPNEIISATTNRYGPHTKSAVVLTGTNVLLDPVATAIEEALPLVRAAGGGPVPLGLRIAAWASAVIEVFRSQPALATAAAKARRIQREFLGGPHITRHPSVTARARCEIGPEPDHLDPVTHPRDLMFLDRTVSYLGLASRGAARDLADELADHLVGLVLDACEPEGVGHVWATSRAEDQVVAEAMLPSSGLVESLLGHWFAVHGRDGAEVPRLVLPSPREARVLPALTRRVLVVAALGIARTIRPRAGTDSVPLDDFLALLDGIEALTGGEPDMAALRARVVLLRLIVLRHNRMNAISTLVDRVIADTDSCLGLCAQGVLDRGAVADLLSAVSVELNAVRTTNALDAADALPSPVELATIVRRYWEGFAATLQADLGDPAPIGHHLHNYAAFLGSQTDQDDLLEAVRLFRDFVIPARRRLHERTGAFGPLGRSMYIATAATSRLGEHARTHGDPAEAVRWARLGYEWIDRVLADDEFARLAGEQGEYAGLFALRAAPALLLALELGVAPVTPSQLARVREWADVAARWLVTATRGRPEFAVRHQEIEVIRKRLAELEC
ncbi:hypothetical protein ACSHWB_34450 [Lentzea sp. HUAS TT2]|uniref:hypothetical protein n=1 Tax=Lentzea sp. HUAS TT2 TaxID=3447454 RepID=UPI003F702707